MGARPAALGRAAVRRLRTAPSRPARILARNPYNTDFKDRVAFWQATEAPRVVHVRSRATSSGATGRSKRRRRCFESSLGGRVGAGLDPCAALQIRIDDPAGRIAPRRVRARPGERRGARGRPRGALLGLAEVEACVRTLRRASGTTTLGAIQVHTPDDSFDLLVNRWLLYQALELPHLGPQRPVPAGRRVRVPRSAAGRAVAALYEAGSLSRTSPAGRLAAVRRGGRSALVASAEPDAARARDARTICCGCRTPRPPTSHDTGDRVACSTRSCRFSRRRRSSLGRPRCTACHRSSRRAASLFEHAVRAIDRSLKYGAHGLPLIGSGDWNDGMNRVGHRGRGESVWLGWFLVVVLKQWAALCEQRRRHRAARSATGARRGGSPACWSSPGTATGTGARISTTARRSDRRRTRSAGSTR